MIIFGEFEHRRSSCTRQPSPGTLVTRQSIALQQCCLVALYLHHYACTLRVFPSEFRHVDQSVSGLSTYVRANCPLCRGGPNPLDVRTLARSFRAIPVPFSPRFLAVAFTGPNRDSSLFVQVPACTSCRFPSQRHSQGSPGNFSSRMLA